tara:strand:- start:334 stop:498 length:165 start_codon:yes stop_codon:yes gene_type:complete
VGRPALVAHESEADFRPDVLLYSRHRVTGLAAPEIFISDATTGRATKARDDAPP